MIRDYSKLMDNINLLSSWPGYTDEQYISKIVKETITKDSVDDAVLNIWAIMVELKYEW